MHYEYLERIKLFSWVRIRAVVKVGVLLVIVKHCPKASMGQWPRYVVTQGRKRVSASFYGLFRSLWCLSKPVILAIGTHSTLFSFEHTI